MKRLGWRIRLWETNMRDKERLGFFYLKEDFFLIYEQNPNHNENNI